MEGLSSDGFSPLLSDPLIHNWGLIKKQVCTSICGTLCRGGGMALSWGNAVETTRVGTHQYEE